MLELSGYKPFRFVTESLSCLSRRANASGSAYFVERLFLLDALCAHVSSWERLAAVSLGFTASGDTVALKDTSGTLYHARVMAARHQVEYEHFATTAQGLMKSMSTARQSVL